MKKRYISIMMCLFMLLMIGCGKITRTEEESNPNKSQEENMEKDTSEISNKEGMIGNVNQEQEGSNLTINKDKANNNLKF